MTGVPDDATQDDIAKHAISKGYATPEDFSDYPEIYATVAPKYESTTAAPDMSGINPLDTQAVTQGLINSGVAHVAAAQHDKLTPTAEQMEEGKDYAQMGWDAALLSQPWLRAAFEAAPLIGQMGIAGATNAAAGAATHGTTDNIVPDAIVGAGGVAAPVITSKAAKPVLDRFTPAAMQYLRGRLGSAAVAEDVAKAEKYVDEAPAAEPESPAAKADRVAAIQAQQNEWLDAYNQKIAHRLVGVEVESYALNGLKETDVAEKGMDALDALNQFRSFTEGYENPHLPFPADERPELSGYGQFEQVMRATHPRVDELITRLDAGEEVSAQKFYDALASYINGTRFELEQFLESSPHVHIDNLIQAVKEAPNTLQWLDAQGVLNPERRTYITAKQAAAHRAGVSDAYAAAMEKLNAELTSERALSSAEYHQAKLDGERNRQTALEHKIKLLGKMQNNVNSLINDAKGIKVNGVTWKDIPEDDRAIYWAMTHTHEAAQRGAKAMRMYEQLEAIRAALPGVRAPTAVDSVLDSTAAQIGAGFMFGGPVGAIAAPVAKAAGDKAVRAVVRRVAGRAERAEIAAAAKEAKTKN